MLAFLGPFYFTVKVLALIFLASGFAYTGRAFRYDHCAVRLEVSVAGVPRQHHHFFDGDLFNALATDMVQKGSIQVFPYRDRHRAGGDFCLESPL